MSQKELTKAPYISALCFSHGIPIIDIDFFVQCQTPTAFLSKKIIEWTNEISKQTLNIETMLVTVLVNLFYTDTGPLQEWSPSPPPLPLHSEVKDSVIVICPQPKSEGGVECSKRGDKNWVIFSLGTSNKHVPLDGGGGRGVTQYPKIILIKQGYVVTMMS